MNVAIWRVFMNATLKAAAHLGNDHDDMSRILSGPLQDNFSGRQTS